MKKRFLSLFFVVVMLAAMFPGTALTAFAEEAETLPAAEEEAAEPTPAEQAEETAEPLLTEQATTIYEVIVKGASFPTAGEHPSFDYTLPNDQPCNFSEVDWYCVTDYTWLQESDTFEAGKVYQLQILFYPKYGYQFADMTNVHGILRNVPDGYYTDQAYMQGSARRINFTFRPVPRFTDVTDPTLFYYDAVEWGASRGIVNGYADGTFRPYGNCTRGAVMAFLYRLANEPAVAHPAQSPFEDVPPTHPFYDAILWGVSKGITTGYSDGTFRPGVTCNRASVVTFLWRYHDRQGAPAAAFSDMPMSNEEFVRAISWAAHEGVTTGYSNNTFRPWASCNRLSVVCFLQRMWNVPWG